MSISYAVVVSVEAHCDAQNIKKILERAQGLGCVYYKDIPRKLKNEKYHGDTSVNEALNHILLGLEDKTGLHSSSIIVHFHKPFLILSFNQDQKSNGMEVGILLFGEHWTIELNNGDRRMDFARYIKLLLDMCFGFPIKNIAIQRF